MPKWKVDIVASTHPEHEQCNNSQRLQGDPFNITGAGEYEIQHLFVYGMARTAEQMLYLIEAEGISLGHPGMLARPLDDAELELFEGVDVLFLPVSGSTAKARSEMISQVEPRMIIPIQYASGRAQGKPAMNALAPFAKEMGLKDTSAEKKIILKQKDLPVEETHVTVLEVV